MNADPVIGLQSEIAAVERKLAQAIAAKDLATAETAHLAILALGERQDAARPVSVAGAALKLRAATRRVLARSKAGEINAAEPAAQLRTVAREIGTGVVRTSHLIELRAVLPALVSVDSDAAAETMQALTWLSKPRPV